MSRSAIGDVRLPSKLDGLALTSAPMPVALVAAQLRGSGNYTERSRLVEVARRKGFLLPVHFAPDIAIARREAGEVATFSADGSPPEDMTERRAELLASFNDGQALLAKFGLKGNPEKIGDGTISESALRDSADRYLSHTAEGRAILKRRGYDSMAIERMRRPS